MRERTAKTENNSTKSSGVLQRKCSCGQHTVAGGECAACRKKRGKLQRRSNGAEPLSTVPGVVNDVLAASGRPLDRPVRQFMASSFGQDFSHVRVHDDSRAARSSRAVKASAYTVGRDIVFGRGQYAPETPDGLGLLAHELTHVIQQGGGSGGLQRQAIEPAGQLGESEAEQATRAILSGVRPVIKTRVSAGRMQRAKGDMVAYSGGQSGKLTVIKGGKWIFETNAVSGKPGYKEYVKNMGPIPAGSYLLHPQRKNPEVKRPQRGVCSVSAIRSGYQEITSNHPVPCPDPTNLHCTESCPRPGEPGRKCYTPQACWGKKRMKIEGSARVKKPSGGKVTRNGFYIHGGVRAVTVTSGCIKVFDDSTFTQLRKLKGSVPLCVGKDCDDAVKKANARAGAEALANVARGVAEGVGSVLGALAD